VHITNHHTWLGSWDELSIALQLRDKSTGVAAESPKVVERSFVRDFIAVIVVRGLAKCLQHLVWSWIWCLIAVAVVSFHYAFIWGSPVEVDCCIDCFSPKNKWRLGVNHHRSCILGDGLDYAFGNPILMVSVRRTWFVCCTTSCEHLSEGLVVVFSASNVAPKLFHFVSHGVNSGLK